MVAADRDMNPLDFVTPGPAPAHRPDLGGCHIWTGRVTAKGYAETGRHTSVHRLMVDLPAGTEVDHLCRVRRCIRRDHLEAVDHATNIRRSTHPNIEKARTGWCKARGGHPYVGGYRGRCKTCHAIREADRYHAGR